MYAFKVLGQESLKRLFFLASIFYVYFISTKYRWIKFTQSIVQALSVDNVIRRHQRVNQGNRNILVRFGKGKQRNCILCTTPNIRSRAITICSRCNKVVHAMCLYRHWTLRNILNILTIHRFCQYIFFRWID